MRRVVTGHDEHGKAIVLSDAPATNVRTGTTGNTSTMMWCSDRMPADIAIGRDVEDMGARILGTPPPINGTRFTVNTLLPGEGEMHRTETLDYVIVVAGEVVMELDDSTITLTAGDVVIQRGTNHAWINRSAQPAIVAFVLIDAEPLGIGNPRPRLA